jgi:hypothetical protein
MVDAEYKFNVAKLAKPLIIQFVDFKNVKTQYIDKKH